MVAGPLDGDVKDVHRKREESNFHTYREANMRILCLHGMGTNSEIFQMQTAAIRHGVGDHHQYEVVEGALPYPMAPGISNLAPPGTETFTYADESSAQSCSKALKDLQDFVDQEGPFDAVMAFSIGAALAATLLIQRHQEDRIQQQLHPIFKCAIFFSGGIPCDPTLLHQQQEIRRCEQKRDGVLIHIPTAHIWGNHDTLYPNFGPVLKDLCAPELREEFVHEGGHEIPGSKDTGGVAITVKIIKRTIERALWSC